MTIDKRIPPLISADDVKTAMTRTDVVIVDARGGADALQRYARGHAAGAGFASLETDLSDIGTDAAIGGRHPLPDPAAFGVFLGKLGITPSSHVLVYDDKAGANAAARFWWMMLAAGHTRIQVIDGGLQSMEKAGIPITTGMAPSPKVAPAYPTGAWQLPLADIDAIERMREDSDALVVDVREGYRYRGEREPIDLVAGHIPGAINLPYTDNLDPDGRFRPATELRKIYSAALGNRPAQQVAVHCGSGVTACHSLLAMEVAGLALPRLYVGSWSEWSRNKKPIATHDGV